MCGSAHSCASRSKKRPLHESSACIDENNVKIDLPSGRFALDDIGNGLPVLFLHGFPHTRALWRHQVAALSQHVRCIAVDLRGFGESTTDGPYGIEQYALDVCAVLDHLEIEQAVIAGLSMGGYIAMGCWRHCPERVLALCLLDTQMNADDEAGRAKRNALMDRVRTEGVEALVEAQLPGMLGRTTRAQRPDLVTEMKEMMGSAGTSGILGALAALRDRPDATDTMSSVRVPTQVIVGDEDALTPPAKAEQLIAQLPAGTARRFDLIAGAGHASCLERPSAVNHVMLEFLNLVQRT
jgi:pimeloyl-ACP methyl ester carboxylesterase